jgi:DNA-binding NarL/FixJ family response regulator
MTIKLLIVDDHAVMRRGLGDLFSGCADIEVVGAAVNGEEGVRMAAEHHPNVVLMDLEMPVMDGVEATRAIRDADDSVQVVVLTSFGEHDRIVEAVRAGASGYLLKDAEPDELVRGVRAAAVGESPFSPRAAKTLLELSNRQEPRRRDVELTRREEEVLALVTDGMSNKAIARRLAISEATVKAHLTRVFNEIGVTGRTQAATWAQRNLRR